MQTENDVLPDPFARAVSEPGTVEFCRAQDEHLAGMTTADTATGRWSTAPVNAPVDMDFTPDAGSKLSIPLRFTSLGGWPSYVVPVSLFTVLASTFPYVLVILCMHERILGDPEYSTRCLRLRSFSLPRSPP